MGHCGSWGLSHSTTHTQASAGHWSQAAACNSGATPTGADGPILSSLAKDSSTYLGFSVAIYNLFSASPPHHCFEM